MQYFAIGGAVSVLLKGRIPSLYGWARGLLVASGLGCFLAFPFDETAPQLLPLTLAGFGTVCLLLGASGARVPENFSGLIYLGKISYGLYVVHQAVLVVLSHLGQMRDAEIMGLLLSIAVAHLSYQHFEMRFLRLKERFEVIRSRPA